jgi:hypothetical protein
MSDVLISNTKGRKNVNPNAVNQLLGKDLFHRDRNRLNSGNRVRLKHPSVTVRVYSIMYSFTCQSFGNVTDSLRETLDVMQTVCKYLITWDLFDQFTHYVVYQT